MVRLTIFLLLISSLWALAGEDPAQAKGKVSLADMAAAERVIGLSFTDEERALMQPDLEEARQDYNQIRAMAPDNHVPPALHFAPGGTAPAGNPLAHFQHWGDVELPQRREDLAWYSVGQLGTLIRTRRISAVELTQFFIDRIKAHDDQLHAVITLTEERALAAAKRADQELAAGLYRGPLHGIPYGAKDLLAVEGYPTTWGAAPYKNQVINQTAHVVQLLDQAGAVLVAKTSLGALAWGEVWFGGTTRNPWNLEQGSSGSSAGSASCVSAGLLPFALGSETYGSIVSPTFRCGITGFRPTFGAVSRHGAMALSWSLDKLGPIARSAEDCAIVFSVIHGADPADPFSRDMPFPYKTNTPLRGMKIGYPAAWFKAEEPGGKLDLAVLEVLRQQGAELVEVTLPEKGVNALGLILSVEAGAAFDQLTRSNQDDELTRQIRFAWPNVFRAARTIPAVEYVQANRIRTQLIDEMKQIMSGVDLLVTPAFAGSTLLLTNLTGHPAVLVPNGFTGENEPHGLTFIGGLFRDHQVLQAAAAYQQATNFEEQRPPLFK